MPPQTSDVGAAAGPEHEVARSPASGPSAAAPGSSPGPLARTLVAASATASPAPWRIEATPRETLMQAGLIIAASVFSFGTYLGYRVSSDRLASAEAAQSRGPAAARPATAEAARASARLWRRMLPGPGATTAPAALAAKAFAYGTVLSLATCGSASLAIAAAVQRAAPRPPPEDYLLTGRDVEGMPPDERQLVIDFGLWLDPRDVSEPLKRERARSRARQGGNAEGTSPTRLESDALK